MIRVKEIRLTSKRHGKGQEAQLVLRGTVYDKRQRGTAEVSR